jgi:hypothetical protein
MSCRRGRPEGQAAQALTRCRNFRNVRISPVGWPGLPSPAVATDLHSPDRCRPSPAPVQQRRVDERDAGAGCQLASSRVLGPTERRESASPTQTERVCLYCHDPLGQAEAISDMTARPSVSASPQERCARDRSLGASMPPSALPRGGEAAWSASYHLFRAARACREDSWRA